MFDSLAQIQEQIRPVRVGERRVPGQDRIAERNFDVPMPVINEHRIENAKMMPQERVFLEMKRVISDNNTNTEGN